MKKIIIISALVLLGYYPILNAQEKILTFEETTDLDFLKTIKGKELLKGFVISTGDTIKLNDTIKFGKPSQDRPTYSSAVNRKVNRYTTIFMGEPNLFSLMNLMYFPEGYENEKVLIDQIIARKVSKNDPALILIKLKFIKESYSHIKVTSFIQSFHNNELLVINGKLTKEMALIELKEAKDKFDLELITKEEYDAIKAKLAPIIMKER